MSVGVFVGFSSVALYSYCWCCCGCADGYACEIPTKGTTITEITPADKDCSAFPQNGVLPALSTGPDLSKIATRSAVNGYE